MAKFVFPTLMPSVSLWGIGTTRDAMPSTTRSSPAYSNVFISSPRHQREIALQEQLVVQNYTKQRAVDLQPTLRAAGVIDKTEFSEPVHEKAHPRTSGPDHLGQALLTDFGDHRLGHTFLAEMSEQKKDSSQPLLAGVKQLVDQILFVADIPRQQIRHEQIGKRVLAVQRIHHRFLVDPQNLAIRHRRRRSHAQGLTCQSTFAKEVSVRQHADARFSAGLGDDGELHFALL